MVPRAELREGHLRFRDKGEAAEGPFIPAALLDSSRRIVAGQVPAGLKAWLTHDTSTVRPGFHAAGVGDLQVAARSIDRDGRVAAYILVWQPRESVDEARHSLLLVMLTIGPILLLAAGVGGWTLAGRALSPVVHVTEAAAAISGSDLSRRVAVGPSRDELSRLAATFNAMIERLQAAVERERRFTADASHELRAPLAVIRAETSLALDRPRPAAEYRRALAAIDEQAEEMEELVRELLLLARAEGGPDGQRQLVPLERVVAAAIEQCRLLRDQRGVGIDARVAEGITVDASPPLLTRAVRNVVDNALRVSRPGDTVRGRGRREGGGAVLTVEDSGPGIPPEHREHLFEPFYQVAAARTPGESHGLGLAICRRIVAAHGGRVGVRSTPGQGACFRIDLPLAGGEGSRLGRPALQKVEM